jgi:hypothetical protein
VGVAFVEPVEDDPMSLTPHLEDFGGLENTEAGRRRRSADGLGDRGRLDTATFVRVAVVDVANQQVVAEHPDSRDGVLRDDLQLPSLVTLRKEVHGAFSGDYDHIASKDYGLQSSSNLPRESLFAGVEVVHDETVAA